MPGLVLGGKGLPSAKKNVMVASESKAAVIASLKAEREKAAEAEAASRKLRDSVRPSSPLSPPTLTRPFEDDLKLWNGKRLVSCNDQVLSSPHIMYLHPTFWLLFPIIIE